MLYCIDLIFHISIRILCACGIISLIFQYDFNPICIRIIQVEYLIYTIIYPLQQSSVYKIPCSCVTSYIRQTSRSFEARKNEHIADTIHNCIAKSSLIEHSSKSKHLIHFDQTQILDREPYYSTCLIKEALKIEKNPNNLNRYDVLKLSQSWAPNINKISNPSPN